MNLVKTKIVADSPEFIPQYQTAGSVCCDLIANVPPDGNGRRVHVLPHRKITQVDCGISIGLPEGFKAEIAIRSGHGKKGLVVVNSPGQVDTDYVNKIKVNVVNVGTSIIEIAHGERFAQLWITPVYRFDWDVVEALEETTRTGGFGSTGK